MPRMLRRAAVLGATAHVASNRGAAQATQQQAAAAPAPVQAAPPPPAAPVADVDPYAELRQLKELLDAGILTQEEFDAKKTQILAT